MSATGNNSPDHPVNALGAYDSPVDLLAAMYRKALDLGHLTRNTPIIEPHVGSGNALRALLQEGHRGPIEIMDIDPLVPGLELGRQLAAQGHHILVDTATPDAEAARWATELARAEKIPENRIPLMVAGFLVRRPVLSGPDAVVFGNPPYSVVPGVETCLRCNGTGIVSKRGKGPGCCPTCKPKTEKGESAPDRGTGTIQPPPIPVAEAHVHRGMQVAGKVIYVLRGPFREGQDRYESLYRFDALAECWTSPRRASFAWGATDSTETAVFIFEAGRVLDPVEGPNYKGRWVIW